MTNYTDRAWFTVEQASALLRVRRNTLYDLCRTGEFPCSRWGGTNDDWHIRIPCEALGLRLRPELKELTYNTPDDLYQLELPLDTACLVPVRRYRNSRELIQAYDYERTLWKHFPMTSG